MGLIPNGKTILDMTFGCGGHTHSLLKAGASKIIGLDRDKTAHKFAKELISNYGDRIIPVHGKFSNVAKLVKSIGVSQVDGVLFDLGLCSLQVDDNERGFSFMRDGPLDMRMDQSDPDTPTAEHLVNQTPPHILVSWLQEFGEERAAVKIVDAICAAREKEPITRTKRLAEAIEQAVPRDGFMGSGRIHPATRTFQALRIAVNRELEELENGLKQAESLLVSGGRMAVISYHSLEDVIVKKFITGYKDSELRKKSPLQVAHKYGIARLTGNGHTSGTNASQINPRFLKVSQSPIRPSKQEIKVNRRARSAKLRISEKI